MKIKGIKSLKISDEESLIDMGARAARRDECKRRRVERPLPGMVLELIPWGVFMEAQVLIQAR